MQKQTSLKLTLFTLLSILLLGIFPMHVSRADNSLNMANMTKILQAEYQTQLKKSHTRSKPKKTSTRSRAEQSILADYQRLLNQSKTARNKPNKALKNASKTTSKSAIEQPPIPDAEDLFDAANRGDVNTIARLVHDGVNINAANQQKETALHIAAARGHYSTVIFLINNGANPFARTVKKWLPIHHATRFRHANIVRYLMQKGLSPRFKTSDGYSSIDMARTNNDRQLLNIFGVK